MGLVSFLFGEDVFISYSRADAAAYAAALANQLTADGFSCFLDQWGTEPGRQIPRRVLRALGRSSMFVLVGSPAAAASPSVQQEAREFLATSRPIVPISVAGALEASGWFDLIAGAAISPEEQQYLEAGTPSATIVHRIANSFRFTKRNRRVRIGFIAATIGLLALIIVASWTTIEATAAARESRESTTRAQVAEGSARRATQRAVEQQAIAEAKGAEAARQEKAALQNAELARKQQKIAEERQRIAQSRQIRFESRTRVETSYDLALLLAAAAKRIRPSLETTDHLTDMLNANVKLLKVLHGHSTKITGIGIVPKSRIVSVDEIGTVIVRNLNDFRLVNRWQTGAKTSAIALNPDGSLLAWASERDIGVLDFVSGKSFGGVRAAHEQTINCLAFTPDGRMLISGSWDNTAAVWRLGTTLQRIRTLKGHKDRPSSLSLAVGVHAVAISGDGRLVATAGGDEQAILWNLSDGTQRGQPLVGHPMREGQLFRGLSSIGFSPDGKLLATGGNNAEVRLWAVETGQPIGESLRGHTLDVTALVFAPDGSHTFSASKDGTVRGWIAANQRPFVELRGHRGAVTALAIDPYMGYLYSGGADGKVLVWNQLNSEERLSRIFVHPSPNAVPYVNPTTRRRHFPDVLTAVAFSRSGRIVASGADDGTIVVWDAATGREYDRFDAFRGNVFAVTISPDDKLIAAAGLGDTVALRRIGSGQTIPLKGHGRAAGTLGFSSDGRLLAVGSQNGNITIWNVQEAARWFTLSQAHTEVSLVSFTANPGRLLSGGSDGRLALWDLNSRSAVRATKFDTRGSIRDFAFAPNSGIAAVTGRSGVALWDVNRWRALRPDLPVKDPEDLAVRSDGGLLATTHDARITLWNIKSGERVSREMNAGGSVSQMSFAPDDGTLASVGLSAAVRLWDIRTDALIRRVCEIANRDLTAAERQEFGIDKTSGFLCAGNGE